MAADPVWRGVEKLLGIFLSEEKICCSSTSNIQTKGRKIWSGRATRVSGLFTSEGTYSWCEGTTEREPFIQTSSAPSPQASPSLEDSVWMENSLSTENRKFPGGAVNRGRCGEKASGRTPNAFSSFSRTDATWTQSALSSLRQLVNRRREDPQRLTHTHTRPWVCLKVECDGRKGRVCRQEVCRSSRSIIGSGSALRLPVFSHLSYRMYT